MKGKIPKILSVALALVLVLSFSLVVAVPVAASPDASNVSVELSDYGDAASGVTYYVYFTPGADLTANVDTITVFFPTGTTSIDATDAARVDQDGDAAPYGNTAVSTKSVAGYRFILTTTVNITAGTEARVEIDGITNPDITTTTKAYTLLVYTSKETTQVASSAYTIGLTKVAAAKFDPSDGGSTPSTAAAEAGTAGLADDYLVQFTTSGSGALTADWDTITVIFPPDTTVPSSIAASSVAINEAGADTWTLCTAAPSVSGRTVTLTVPTITSPIGNSELVRVWFKAAAGIKNPTLATDANNINVASRYVGKFYTSQDVGLQRQAFTVAVNAAPACALGFLATSPASVPVSTASGNITVQSKDQHGNLSNVPVLVPVAISSSSTTGTFLGDDDGDGTLNAGGLYDDSTTGIAISQHQGIFSYKDTTLGTPTITASYPAHAWTPATCEIQVYPLGEVNLYDGTVLIGTYTTIKDALTNAAAGNIIKVGPGTYSATSGETFPITVNKANLTIESTDGAASTVITGVGAAPGQSVVTITADNVTLQNFSVLSETATNQKGIYVSGATNALIKNNIVTSTAGNVIGIDLMSTTTNTTVSGNQLTDCTMYFDTVVTSCKILDNEISNGAITLADWVTKLTIRGNTISSGPDHGIQFLDVAAGRDADEITIEGNTITGLTKSGIWFQADADATATNVIIAGNGITANANAGILIEDWSATNAIKFNDISGNTAYGIKNTTATNVNATHNWWGTSVASEIAGMINDTSTGVTSYDPWLGASVSVGQFVLNATSLDASATVGVKVSGVDSSEDIGVARYTANPAGTPAFTPLEDGFFDVYVSALGSATEVGIKFYDAAITSDSVAYMWDAFEEVWQLCTEQSAISGMVWVKAHPYSATAPAVPTIEDLNGTVFAISGEEVPPEDKGDFDGDGDIDLADFVEFAAAYGSSTGDANYNAAGDFDDSGDIGLSDFVEFAAAYGA